MKIVTYNVNGLRSRVSQHGSLLKLLNSLDADIICFQETKLSRQDLSADIIMAEGYEAFFSCTRTSDKGRICYSGVATFCRVKSPFSSNEVALPISAEEGITGLLEYSRKRKSVQRSAFLEEIDDVSIDDLLNVDSEGRCIITDHGHFVLFNIYGPRAQDDDLERINFKSLFFLILQKRWQYLLSQGKRVFVVGDLNIAPSAVDRCDAKPDFEENRFRKWFRSLLTEDGGDFVDCFRARHPDRTEAYTCWAQDSGAEEFNFGSRIDHIVISRQCFHHHDNDIERHSFPECHLEECDIMMQFRRAKLDSMPKWKGGRSVKLEGSDHAPVYVLLRDIPNLPVHSTPSLAVRYVPEVRGCQQTIVSMLTKRQVSLDVKSCELETSATNMDSSNAICSEHAKPSQDSMISENEEAPHEISPFSQSIPSTNSKSLNFDHIASGYLVKTSDESTSKKGERLPANSSAPVRKMGRTSQQSIRSFFQRSNKFSSSNEVCSTSDVSHIQVDINDVECDSSYVTDGISLFSKSSQKEDVDSTLIERSSQDLDDYENINLPCEVDRGNMALLKWQQIQQKMQNSLPLCKGHREPCVARTVKKSGPNIGRGFYVCARAKGPASNPEANCGYFKWASAKSKQK